MNRLLLTLSCGFIPLFFTAQTPGGVTGNLELWLKADAGVTVSGTKVTQWDDQSGNNRHHTQGTDLNRPDYINSTDPYLFNHQPTLRFNRTNQNRLETPSYNSSLTNSVYLFVVSRLETGSGYGGNTWHTTYSFNSDCLHSHWFGTNTRARISCAERNASDLQVTYALNSYILPKGTGTLDPSPRIFWNGSSATVAKTSYTINNNTFTVGSDRNYTDFMNGDIAEVIIYNGTSTTSNIPADDLAKIQSYLALKYGISLDPSGQPNYVSSANTIIWNGITNSGYQNNIIGLGRDDNSALYQKQATSYPNAHITLFTGSLHPLNNDNTSTFASDNSFILLGDNNSSGFTGYIHSIGSTFLNGTTSTEMNYISNRKWKAQTTTIGSWVVNIKTNKFNSACYVLVSSSSSFLPGNTRIYPVVNGIANNVTINNGEYIAMGLYQQAPGGVANSLRVWLKAESGFTPAKWEDQSPYANNYTQINTSRQPTALAADALYNFHPVVNFGTTGTDARFMVVPVGKPFSANGLPGSIFITTNHTSVSGNQDYLGFGATLTGTVLTNANYPVTGHSAGKPYIFNGSWPIAPAGVIDVTAGVTNILDFRWEMGTSPVYIARTGKLWTSSNISKTILNTLTSAGSILGAQVEECVANIPEVIAYERYLTGDELQRVRSYLAIKYGKTLQNDAGNATVNYLSSTSETVWDITVNSSFNNNLFGIANDVKSSLDQRVSTSMNTGAIATIATISDFSTANSDGSRPSVDTSAFLLIGDNNITSGTTILNPADCPSLNDNLERLDRIWLTQETNETGVLYLEIDLNSFSLDHDIHLLVADDDALSTNMALLPAESFSGGIAIFRHNFKDKQYFTVAGKTSPPDCATCVGGSVTVKDNLQWNNSGNKISNTTGSYTVGTVTSGTITATSTVSGYDAQVEEPWQNHFPRNYAGWTQLVRRDNINHPSGVITYTTDLSVAAKTNFRIRGFGNWYGIGATVVIKGYCGLQEIHPKVTPEWGGNQSYNKHSISGNTISSTKNGLGFYSLSGVNVYFDRPVEKIVIEWTVDRPLNWKTNSYLYISNLNLECEQPVEPTPDNVYVFLNFDKDTLLTCEESVLRIKIDNRNCDDRTLYFQQTLPPGIEFIDTTFNHSELGLPYSSILPTILTPSTLSFDSLDIPSGISNMYIRVKSTTAVTADYSTQASYVVKVSSGGNGDTLLSDNLSGLPGLSPTAIRFIASSPTTLPDFSVTALNTISNDTTYLATGIAPGDVIEYTYSFTNTSGSPLSGLELIDGIGDQAEYIPGSLTASAGVNYTSNNYGDPGEENTLRLENLEVPIGTSTVNIQAYVQTSTDTIPSLAILNPDLNNSCYSLQPEEETTTVTPSPCSRGGYLIPFGSSYTATLDTCRTDNWIYHYDNDHRAIFAVYPNGNTWNPSEVRIDALSFVNNQSNGIDSATVFQRIAVVNHLPVANPVRIRVYYNSSELSSEVPLSAYPTQGWFKHEEDKPQIEADLLPMYLLRSRAIELIPDSSGMQFGLDFVEFHGITNFSSFGFTGNTSDVVLPVTWLSFSVEHENQKRNALLKWVTATEKDNEGFEIEHSTDGISFTKIGFVEGSGTTSLINSYSYTHMKVTSGINYYRLKQIDFNGDSNYSQVRVLHSGEANENMINCFPNPSSGEFYITSTNTIKDLTLVDAIGKIITKINNIGETSITFENLDLKNGIYHLLLTDINGIHYTQKIIIQKTAH